MVFYLPGRGHALSPVACSIPPIHPPVLIGRFRVADLGAVGGATGAPRARAKRLSLRWKSGSEDFGLPLQVHDCDLHSVRVRWRSRKQTSWAVFRSPQKLWERSIPYEIACRPANSFTGNIS